MLVFLTRRFGQLLFRLFLISVVVFFMLRLMPGDPAIILAGQDATQEVLQDIRSKLGLDRPIYVQYARYLEGIAQADLGQSIRSRQPVSEEIANRMLATLSLTILALTASIGIGLVLGITAAVRVGRWPDLVILVVSLLGVSAPSFWIGLMLMLLFAVQLGWLPVAGGQGWTSYILPVATLVPLSLAVFARLTRSTMLDVLGEDYIRTAISKGARRRTVLWRHALRNALVPIVTMGGLEFVRLLGGVIAVETIFAWPGAGKALVDAIGSRDFPMVQGIVLTFAVLFSVSTLMVDVVNGFLDPRLRQQ